MTPARDAIKLIRKQADRIEALEADVVKWEEFANDMLDGKNKRIEALERECFALAANQCHAGYGDDYGNHRCRRVEALEAALRMLIDNVKMGSYESTGQAIAAIEASLLASETSK